MVDVLRGGQLGTLATVTLDDGAIVEAFIPYVNTGGGGGGGGGSNVVITGPLGAQAIGASVAVNPATASSWPVTGTFFQATQPVSAASLPLPAGAATSALQSTINTTLGTPFQAGGSVGISGTLPAFAATPTVNLGTIGGGATEATLAAQSAKFPASLGIKTAANSFSIAPASDGVFPVTGTFWQATQPVSIASLPALPANQSSNIAQINGITPLMGNGTTGTGSLRVTVASDQTAFSVNLGTIAGVATETTLAAASAKLPASVGAKAANASLSVSNSFLAAAALGDGSVSTTAETITVATTVQIVEFFNLSANVIWLSWTGTAVASTTGSFPVPALAAGVAGYYSAPPGASGSLSVIAVTGASAFTCVGWS